MCARANLPFAPEHTCASTQKSARAAGFCARHVYIPNHFLEFLFLLFADK